MSPQVSPMPLAALLPAGVPAPALTVGDVYLDSRQVQPGGLFLAIPGGRQHGLVGAPEAERRGAVAVAYDPVGAAVPLALAQRQMRVPLVPVVGLATQVANIARRRYGEQVPALVVGVTGTNGKTTCAWLLAQAWQALGLGGGLIGTLGWGRPAALVPAERTTPDVVSVHRELAAMAAEGLQAVAMEVSSHALVQARVAAVPFTGAAFTNLSHDHLDYHRDIDDYAAAKARLFARPELQFAVINGDDSYGERMAAEVSPLADITRYCASGRAVAGRHLRLSALTAGAGGLTLQVEGSFGHLQLATPLLGRFNAANLLAVCSVLLAGGVAPAALAPLCRILQPAPGRMQAVAVPGRPLVVIDYAHTPAALAAALAACREHTTRRLICVFGCGGDRDRAKRPAMGAIAERLADVLVLTDDNPRGEDPAVIIAEILAGLRREPWRVVHDRAQAIVTAIALGGPGDVVLVAGKGHERYQEIGNSRQPFSDAEVVADVLGVAA